ncbi:UTP:GlnB (protein PII) uridylyltransferase [Actinobacteria bacterium IMCC26207]|nr:UTP:GlnB (protein PII) uridylyltransferase [Actinobacteria bacterium IMCC26207]
MSYALQRSDFLDDRQLQGRDFCVAYTELIESWLVEIFEASDAGATGVALVAVGGQGRCELAPQSDLDLLLLHARDAPAQQVAAIADALWYPIWDAGLKLGHAVRNTKDTLALANEDLVTATALLSARHIAGDAALTAELAEKAKVNWRKRGKRWLSELSSSVEERHRVSGELAFDLEPDLKEGRGGLRDVHALSWARAAGADIDESVLDSLAPAYDELLAVRIELHRCTARPGDQLLMQEQDAVAAAVGDADADLLMARVAAAGRTIAWATDECFHEIKLSLGGPFRDRFRRERQLDNSLVLRNARVCLAENAVPVTDPLAVLQVALAAARNSARIEGRTLEALALAPALSDPWPASAQKLFVELLRHGSASIPVIETLDQFGLWTPLIPEWEPCRSLPQRNVFHHYTVDRHLLECSAEAASLAHRTPRPDLLVIAALLHDIGKAYPGDHSKVGMQLTTTIAGRMGFNSEDQATLEFLVLNHLLLSEIATRRDLDDPATIEGVAKIVETPDRLALLRALSEADGVSTGETSWGPWKAQLVEQLSSRVANLLNGVEEHSERSSFPNDEQRLLMQTPGIHISVQGERITVVCPDRLGAFFRVAGALALHDLDVVGANVYSENGVALDEFQVTVGGSAVLPWDDVRADILKSLEGRLAVQARLEDRVRRARRRPLRGPSQFPSRVRFDNDATAGATVLEAVGPDRIGLLYGLTRALADLDLNVSSAKIHTMGEDVIDTFYLTLAGGGQVQDPEHQDEIRLALMHVLEPSV